jgi:hypothetical protein
LNWKSKYRPGAPVAGLRVKPTPAGGSAGVAEHHRLHRDRGADVVADGVHAAVAGGFWRVPGAEDGVGGGGELFVWVGGEGRAGLGAEAVQHRQGEGAQFAMVQLAFGVGVGLGQGVGDQSVKRCRGQVGDDLGVALDETSETVPGEAGVAG